MRIFYQITLISIFFNQLITNDSINHKIFIVIKIILN